MADDYGQKYLGHVMRGTHDRANLDDMSRRGQTMLERDRKASTRRAFEESARGRSPEEQARRDRLFPGGSEDALLSRGERD